MKNFTCFLFFVLAAFAINAQKIINDPNAVQRAAKDFHAISISNAFNVYLTQGSEEAVAVSASDPKYADMIQVEVRNGILFIDLKKNSWRWMKGNKKLKAYISFKDIDKIDISGASDVYIQGSIRSNELKIDLSGASNLKGMVETKKMVANVNGASDMKLTGRADELTVDAGGASKFQGIDLVSEFCKARATGASDIRITVNKELSAQASGASDIKYKGQGVIRDIKTSGAGNISKI